jgi:Putative metal-binding motif
MSRTVTTLAAVGALALTLIAAPAALADDDVAGATLLVSGVPQQVDTSTYTIEGGEPNTTTFLSPCGSGQSLGVAHTAWFYLVGTGGQATVTTEGSMFDTALFAYDSSLRGGIVACNDDSGLLSTSTVTFPTHPRTTYYIQAGSACNGSSSPCPTANGGPLRILATIAPNPDVDGDGIPGSQAGGVDCNDNDLRVRPGAYDIPGDGFDQDCDGRDAALPRPTALRVAISMSSKVHETYTRIAKLTAVNVPAGATVTVSCATKALGCRFSSRTTSVKVARTLGLGKIIGRALTRAKLRKGAKIEVRVTSAGHVGTVARFTIRKGKTPTRTTLCVPPGAAKPTACA